MISTKVEKEKSLAWEIIKWVSGEFSIPLEDFMAPIMEDIETDAPGLRIKLKKVS